MPQNKIQEIKKLLAKSLNKKIAVEKVGDQDKKYFIYNSDPVTGVECSD